MRKKNTANTHSVDHHHHHHHHAVSFCGIDMSLSSSREWIVYAADTAAANGKGPHNEAASNEEADNAGDDDNDKQ